MHCMNCGAQVPATARFCADCGAPADTELTRAAGRGTAQQNLSRPANDELERVLFTTRPTLLFIGLGYAAAALGALALIFLLALLQVPALISVPVALALLLIPAFYHVKRNTVRYTLTDSKIEIDRGLIARTTRSIPLRNVQDVTVSASIPQRLLGFGNLIVDNASEEGGITVLKNIPKPRRHADMLLRELRRWH